MSYDPASLLQTGRSHCNVQRYSTSENKAILPYSRRDYFKIWVVDGESMVHYASKSIHITQPALIFSNPLVPYSFERISEKMSGYIFIFTDEFFRENNRQESLMQSPLFQIGHNSVFFLNDEQLRSISAIYDKMLEEFAGDYVYKYDVIRNYGNLLVHEAMKMQPALSAFRFHNATTRIANHDYERFGLCDQLRRSSKSIPANIAEGYGRRRSAREFKHYLTLALGSANETIVHLEIARALVYADQAAAENLIETYNAIGKMLYRLIETWHSAPVTQPRP